MANARNRIRALARQVEEIRSSMNWGTSVGDLTVPDIIEFCLSPAYLNLRILYPRQATLLKLMFLQPELLSDYDFDVIGEWTSGLVLPDTTDWDPESRLFFEGPGGVAPDILDRVETLKAEGHMWFPESYNVTGRRGSKGFLGAIAGAYVTYNVLALGCPQDEMGIAPTKSLSALVFAGNRKQARDLQWFDLAEMIVQAPCFAPFIVDVGKEQLTLATPADLDHGGGVSEGSIHILAKEATSMAGRGHAAYMAYFDELAHVSVATANTSSEELVANTMPALDQCGTWSFVYSGSSPWQKIGAFYENYLRGLEVDPATHRPMDPDPLVCQFTSWDLYRDWEIAEMIPTIPSEIAAKRPGYSVDATPALRTFPKLKKAIQTYDKKLERRELRDPVRFAVEYRSQWASVIDPFLNPVMIARMFDRFRGNLLREQHAGQGHIEYYAHGDAATVGDNFVWMITHAETLGEDKLTHTVVDKIRVWEPRTFPNGTIEYLKVYADIVEDFRNFNIVDASFDQYQATMIVELLRTAVRDIRGREHANIHEIHQTHGSNRAMADVFRPALNSGQVHCYPHELLDNELHFLQEIRGKVDHPTSGPVITNDASTCLMVLVERLHSLNADHKIKAQFSAVGLSGRPMGSMNPGDREVLDALSAVGRSRTVRVGERAYPGGPKRLPPWAGG